MVTRAGQDRYRLLDTLRAYAVDVLADLDADATRDRHAAYYAEWAERGADEIRGPNQFVWLEYLRADINNFRAALEWSLLTGDLEPAARLAGALSWFWTLNGMLTEAIQHLERLVDVDSVPAPVRAKCLWGHALVSASLGRLETARDAGYAAAELGRSHDDLAGTAYGLNAAAVAEWALGNHERSFDAHTEAVVLLEKVDDWWGLAVCKVLQARTLFDQTDPAAASVAREGEADARRSGDRHVLGLALTQIAHIALGDGDHDAAIAAAAEGLGLQEAIGYTEGAISALHVLGQAHRSAGHVAEARTLHRQALGLAARIGHVAAMCEAMEDLARTEADDEPTLAGLLIRAAASERDARGIPLRPRDAIDLDSLQASLTPATGVDPPERPFMSLVAELAQ